MFRDWNLYYSKLSRFSLSDRFVTSAAALIGEPEESTEETIPGIDTTAIGDEGELFVYKYEKKRVNDFNPRFTNKVLHLGKTKGLGYDIQSVIAEEGPESEFVKYIEVKSTRRVTEPNLYFETWMDTVTITRNEYIAANQHKEYYSLFRVYFVRGRVLMYIIKNLYQKEKNGMATIVPLTYRVDYPKDAIDSLVVKEDEEDFYKHEEI